MKGLEVDPCLILFPNTYISSTNRYTIRIFNNTAEKISYEWRKLGSLQQESRFLGTVDLGDPDQRVGAEEALRFRSKIFQFQNDFGEIWPNGFVQATVSFTPELSNQYTETAYLYSKETGDRIQVTLKGGGLAPEAKFSAQSISVGHVAVESVFEYQVMFINTGKAVVEFEMEPRTVPGLIFEFSPTTGTIPVGGSIPMNIRFVANSVCSFTETFVFQVKGSTICRPSLLFYGKIIGPSYALSVKSIDFGVCSFGFMYKKTVEIENRSEIPFDYTFRLEYDGSFARREFAFRPCKGTLQKFEKHEVTVEFIPVSVQDYDVKMCLDIAKYGESLTVIPITAKCVCPEVNIKSTDLNLGDVYIGYEYKVYLEMSDDTDYPAKFEYVSSNDISQLEAKTTVKRPTGVIPAHGTARMSMKVTPTQLGPMTVQHYLKIYGNESSPIPFTVSGTCIGPTIFLANTDIDFGKIPVLQDIRRSIEVRNDSVINSFFKVRIDDENNVFQCENERGEVKPGETAQISIVAHLNDTSVFFAKAVLIFQHLNPIYIPLKAIGTGTCIVPSIGMEEIDLGYIFTERPVITHFVLENLGRRKQELRWTCQKMKVEGRGNPTVTMKITPEQTLLLPNASVDMQLILQADIPCSFETSALCATALTKRRMDLFNPSIKGTFIRPLLSFSEQTVSFKHLHDITAEEQATGHISSSTAVVPSAELLVPLHQELTITNRAQIPLVMRFDCPEPFSFSEDEFSLESGCSHTFGVTFDPSFKKDFISEVVNKKLVVSFKGHPQKMSVNLKGEIVFPNVDFTPGPTLDFGIMLMNTEQALDVMIKNTTELPVDMFWEMASEDGMDTESSKIFDIYPIRMHIDPFQEDIIRASFFALGDAAGHSAKYHGKAICHVVGGPEYTIDMLGESAAIKYTIEPAHFNFGVRSYKDKLSSKFLLQNLSDVPIKYSTKIPKGCRFASFSIFPNEGTLKAGERIEIQFQITTGLPLQYNESFFVQIGHFDEVQVDLTVNCFIPQLQFELTRHEDDEVMALWYEQQQKRLTRLRRKATLSTDSESESMSTREPLPDELNTLEREMLVRRLKDKNSSPLIPSPQRRTRPRNSQPELYDGPVTSRHVLNMGTIILGDKLSKEFKVRSASEFPISFDVQTTEIAGTGFSIDPTCVKDLPAGEELTITVTFDTKERTNDLIEEVEYRVPFILGEETASMLYIRACLEMPVLSFSQTHCDFGNVIIGQSFIVTLQVQNMNNVPCQFTFADAQFINSIQRSSSDTDQVFTASPAHETLPPASFQNVEITFAPIEERNYSMQFPINIRYNTQPSYITLRGSGVQLKVIFDPPELILPPLTPFSDPSTMTVRMINPTDYPIEVLSNQFDTNLLVEKILSDQGLQLPDPGVESLVQFGETQTSSRFSKFSLCVIVHGAKGSGKTTISQTLSSYLGGIPIIDLKQVWGPISEKIEITQAEYVEAFADLISQPKYADGFIIDGLDCLPEPVETDHFAQHCMKIKNIEVELENNPFMSFPHQHMTAAEQTLAYVLAALDGHYVFLVGLRASEELLSERDEIMQAKEKRKHRQQKNQEKKALMQMSEEQYLAMCEEEQMETDAKRFKIRDRLLQTALEALDDALAKKGRRRARTASKSQRKVMKPKPDEKKEGRDRKLTPTKKAMEVRSPSPRNRKFRSLSFSRADPIMKSLLRFMFTFGSLAERVREGGDCFQVIDPIAFLQDSTAVSQVSMLSGEEEEVLTEQEKIQRRTATPMPGGRLPTQPVQTVFTNENTIIIDVSERPSQAEDEVCKFIPKLNQLKEKAFTKLIPMPRTLRSAACFKKPELASVPSFFSIVVDDPTNEIMQRLAEAQQANSPQKRTAGRKSRFGKKGKNLGFEISDEFDLTRRTRHWSIDAKSEAVLTVKFDGKLIGQYKDVLTFCIHEAKSDIFKLPVSGVCAYPELDRDFTKWFPKCVKKFDGRSQNVFVTDSNEFNFGSVLIAREKPAKGPGLYSQDVTLRNISRFPAEVTVVLSEGIQKNTWCVKKPKFVIPPGETYDYTLGVNPIVPDVYRANISFFIKDQPEPISLNMCAEGCVPKLELSTQVLDFGKLLLKQQMTLELVLSNTGKLPVAWRLKGFQALGASFTLNATEGVIDRGSSKIVVCYQSAKPMVCKKTLQIEVLDIDNTRVFATLPVQVEAESFDVNFDFQYPRGLDHLNFGPLKVGQTKTITCTLKNKGKYPSQFKICVATQRIQKLFQIKPLEGIIGPSEKTQTLEFAFTAKTLLKFANAKGLSLRITDTLTETVTADIPISFSAQSVYSNFVIEPQGAINFGSTPVNVPVLRQFKLTNVGVFPFEFDFLVKEDPIVPKNDDILSPEPKKARKTLAKPSPSPKAKGRRSEKSMFIGNFRVSPSTAVLAPGTSAQIEVEYLSQFYGHSQSKASIRITDGNPNQIPDGIPIDFSGDSYMPGLETKNFKEIFPLAKKRLRIELESGQRDPAFIEDENVFSFGPIFLQRRVSTTVAIINPHPIPIAVDVNIAPTKIVKQARVSLPFEVTETEIELEPNQRKTIELSFLPVTPEEFTGVFEAVVRNGLLEETRALKFRVEGIGTLPSICSLSQSDGKQLKGPSFNINIGRVLVGNGKERVIPIMNNGLIDSRISITSKTNPSFTLRGVNQNEEIILEPGRIINMSILFEPSKVQRTTLEITAAVIDNPKANLTFMVTGEGFVEDILLEGLSEEDQSLVLKDCIVGRQMESKFVMHNISDSDIRFTWAPHNDFIFTPTVGHLGIGKSKEIRVSFFTEKPTKCNGLKFNCQWNKIRFNDPGAPDWDDSMKMIKFVTRGSLTPKPADQDTKKGSRRNVPSKKPPPPPEPSPDDNEIVRVTEVKPEPKHQILPCKCKDLQMKITAISDVVKYTMDTKDIDFSPTMMYQSRSVSCKLTNTCQIRIHYRWIVTEFQALRTPYLVEHSYPFSVQPASGVIEPGRSTVFKVSFSPEDADDFKAVLVCDIQYLSQLPPPTINVSGLSRRPLCYFDVKTSDYVSRRGPEFTQALPSDVKVIELFSKEVGARVTKKFEIVNPTSTSYEVVWKVVYDTSNGQLMCDTPAALISSGRRYFASFTYQPILPQTVETLYEFVIVECDVVVPVLIVGRIVPQ